MKKNFSVFCYTLMFDDFLKDIVCNVLMAFLDVFEIFFLKSVDGMVCIDLERKRNDIAYLTDFFPKLKPQRGKMCPKAECIMSFINKIVTYKNGIERRNFYQFPCLQALEENNFDHLFLLDAHVYRYSSPLQAKKEDLLKRFKDLDELKISDLVKNPFQAEANYGETKATGRTRWLTKGHWSSW